MHSKKELQQQIVSCCSSFLCMLKAEGCKSGILPAGGETISTEAVLEAKIQMAIPPENSICRKRLLQILETGSEKLVILTAGAGFGKTDLLSHYGIRWEGFCAWYELTAMDNDVLIFLKYLTASLNKCLGGFLFSLDKYRETPLKREKLDLIAGEFAASLYPYGQKNIAIILDDFQNITNGDIFYVVQQLIQNTGKSFRFFLSLRSGMPRFSARFLLKDQAKLITARDLAFNREEVLAIMKEMVGRAEEEVADQIFDETEGWPAGVMSAILAFRQNGWDSSREDCSHLCENKVIYNYIMYEVYRRQPEQVQDFLALTSVFPILDQDLINSLFHFQNGGKMLRQLEEENLFLLRIQGKRGCFRYHLIFKWFLEQQVPEEKKTELRKRAAAYYIKKGDMHKAIEYAALAGSISILDHVFCMEGEKLLKDKNIKNAGLWVEYVKGNKERLSGKTCYLIGCYYKEIHNEKCAEEFFSYSLHKENRKRESWQGQALLEMAELYLEESRTMQAEEILSSYLKKTAQGMEPFWIQLKLLEVFLTAGLMEKQRSLAQKLFTEGPWQTIMDNRIRYFHKVAAYLSGGRDMEDWESPGEDAFQGYERLRDIYYWIEMERQYKKGAGRCVSRLLDEHIKRVRRDHKYGEGIYLLALLYGREPMTVRIFPEFWTLEELEFFFRPVDFEKLPLKRGTGGINETEEKDLYITCFGDFQVMAEPSGEKIRWRTRKTKELFAYLYYKKGKGVSREQISEAIWPDITLDSSTTLFHTTLSYARKALLQWGLKDIILYHNKNYYLDMKRIGGEDERLYYLCQRLLLDGELGDAKEAELRSLYQDSYMGTMNYDWAYGERESYEKVYLDALRQLADRNMSASEYEKAAEILKKSLEINPYSEENSEAMIRCLGQLGRKKDIRILYEKTKKLFQEELSVEVSEELVKAYKETMKSR